jgi:two-component system chemotaxis response regulator CheY
LVLLDMMMPGPSGLDVLRAIRANARLVLVPVIILTADGKVESEQQALADGASGFMMKPFSPMALMTMIARFLDPA